MKDPIKYNKNDALKIRKRIEYEDQLLISRTNIVLLLNGLMTIAASLGPAIPNIILLIAASVIILINIIWIPCAIEAHSYIKFLSIRLQRSKRASIDEKLRYKFLKNSVRIGPTVFISICIPIILTLGWIFALFFSIYKQPSA